MTQIPDLFQMELDTFTRDLITAALEAADGDPELAAALKQSPKRFVEEGRRLGLIKQPEVGDILKMPEPIVVSFPTLPGNEEADEVATRLMVTAELNNVEEPDPEDAQTAASDAGQVLDRGNSGVGDPDPQEPPRKSRPGRPAGRRRSPLGDKPLPVSGSRRLPRLRREASTPGGESEAVTEAAGELSE